MLTSRRQPALIRILVPEGSSLSAREAVSALGPLGYQIDVCDPNPFCICRFSRFVKKFHRSPAMGKNPLAYLRFLIDLLEREPYDVLLPVHEHAFLFARVRNMLSQYVGLAVADFSSFERVQSKACFMALLDELELPHPRTRLIRSESELEAINDFPFYVKAAIGTAGSTVWRVNNRSDLTSAIAHLKAKELFDKRNDVLVQKVASGILEVAQSVFDSGRLISICCYQQQEEGVGGSAAARIGVSRPTVRNHTERIGQYLNWHGSLMLDYMFDLQKEQPLYIEANPRMGETMNATLSGVNIADMVVRLSMNEPLQPIERSRLGVESHTLMGILLGVANRGGSRLALLHEIEQAIFKKGRYVRSEEEFVRPFEDPLSLIPLLAVSAALFFDPGLSSTIATRAVSDYSLNPAAVELISELKDL